MWMAEAFATPLHFAYIIFPRLDPSVVLLGFLFVLESKPRLPQIDRSAKPQSGKAAQVVI
jgi:hypothetical protein